MPDITMCIDKECPLRNKCYRFIAKPWTVGQSYALIKYDNGCPHYWEVKNGKSSN